MGLMVGDYNSPYSYSLNPALSRTNPSQRAYINWWGASVSGENNFMQYNAPFRIGAWIANDYPSQYRNINGSMAFQQDWLPVNTTVDHFRLNYLSEVYGPSFFIPVDDIGTFGFGVKEVSGLSINGVNGDFGGILRYGTPHLVKHAGKNINQNEFSINTEKYQEWFMNFSGIAKTDDENVWKWGTTMKFLIGMGLAHIGSDNLNFGISADAQSININQFNGSMFRSGTGAYNTLSRPMGMSFDFIEGAGMGVDLGVVYEHRPQGAKSKSMFGSTFCDREALQKYDWKFGASISDLGFINYQGSGSGIVSLGNRQWTVDPKIIQNTQFSGEDRLKDLDQRLFQRLGAESLQDIFSTTPAALNVQFDKYVGGNFHMGAYWTQNLKRINSVGLRRASYLNVTPRWQTEQWEYGTPITLANDYSTLHVGLYGRLGPVIFGTDNLVGLGEYLNKEKFTGMNIYFGVRSKIGGCNNRTRQYSVFQKETFYDTVYQVDTQRVNLVKVVRDTVVETKKETVNIKSIDSLNKAQIALETERAKLSEELNKKKAEIETLKQNSDKAQKECQDRLAVWIKDAEKCKKTQAEIEAELKKKNAEIEAKQKEWELEKERLLKLSGFPKSTVPKTDTIRIDCAPELAKKQAEIEVLENQRNKALIALDEAKKSQDALLKNCEEEKKSLQVYLDKIQLDLGLANKTKANLEAENKILKDQIERLSLNTAKTPCDSKLLECERNIVDVNNKNAVLSLELEKEKAKTRNTQLALDVAENKARNAIIESTNAKADALKWKNSFDQIAAEKKLCDEASKNKDAEIASLKSQLQLSKTENERLKALAKSNTVPTEDCTPFKTRAAQLELELNKAKADLATALAGKEDCTPFKTRAAQLELELNKAKAEAAKSAQLELELNKAKADLATALAGKEDCTPLKLKITSLETELAKSQAQNKTDLADITKLKAQIQTLEKESSLVKNCDVCENALKTANANLATANANLITSENKLKESQLLQNKCNTELAELKKQVQASLTLKAENDELKKKISILEAQVEELESTSNASKIDELSEEIKRLKADIARKDNQINACKLQSDQCTKKLSEVEIKLADSERARNTAVTTAETLRKQVVSLDEDIAKMGEIIKTNNAEISKLNTEVSSLKTKLKTCESKVAELSAPKDIKSDDSGN